MRFASSLGLLSILILTACSSVSIVPRPATPGATVNPSDKSITINQSGLTVSARVQDTAVGGYAAETALTSFYVTIQNGTGQVVDCSLDQFSLADSAGSVYRPIPPEEVNALLNPAITAFMPVPFVGYYDIVDLAEYRQTSAMASEQAYLGSGLPAVENLTPLTLGPVRSGERVSGMLYFPLDVTTKRSLELVAAFPLREANDRLTFSFPFSIEK